MVKREHPNATRLENVRQLLALFKPIIDDSSKLKWRPSDGFWLLLCRCMIRRQFESMETVVKLVNGEDAHAALPLLRAACEEFIWLSYLRSIEEHVCEQIILHKSQLEIAASLRAQTIAAGKKQMIEFGFTPEFLDSVSANKHTAQRELRSIGLSLGWNLSGKRYLPSARFIAEKTNEAALYDLIYHATSKAVHFTVTELLRRAWGNASEVLIGSAEMNAYWADFSLYWGWKLFFLTFAQVAEVLEKNKTPLIDFENNELLLPLVKKFIAPGQVPIITPEELNLRPPPSRSQI